MQNNNLKEFARQLRNNSTKGEVKLWTKLLRSKNTGYQFNRQFIIDKYIVDFVCRKLKLIVEIDGGSHFFTEEKDYEKQQYLKSLGYSIVRFTESDVIYKYDEVAKEIEYTIEALSIRNEENN